MEKSDSLANLILEASRLQSGDLLYLPSMYDSDEDDYDEFVPIQDPLCESRDDYIKKAREGQQQRRGSQYSLLRCLAWSVDEENETSCPVGNSSSLDTNENSSLQTFVESICTISPPPILEVSRIHHHAIGKVLWEQQLPSDGDLCSGVICRQEKQ